MSKSLGVLFAGILVVTLLFLGCINPTFQFAGRYYTQPDRTETAGERADRYLQESENEEMVDGE